MAEFENIPVLDVGALSHPNGLGLNALVDAFGKAYGEVGFAYIVNHGIDPDLRRAVFAASKAFHDLPLASKMDVELDANHRGYIAINTSTDVNSSLADVSKPNQSASFMAMREDAVADPLVYLSGPNQWPELDGFRATCDAYVAALIKLASGLMRVACRSVGANPDVTMTSFDPPTTWLRLLHYPPSAPRAPDDLYGSAPHCDFGCLTILAQDDVGGLEVQTPAGNWVAAPYMEDAFVVNVGDMLHRMSNGKLRSTPHRVINRSGRERLSVPFFYDPHVSADLRPLEGTGAPVFAPVNFGDFLRGELEAAYRHHQLEQSKT